jgi:urease accessory protein
VTAAAAEGLLDLRFARGTDGDTVLVERRQRFPLRLTVPFALDPGEPGMAFVYVQNPTGGIFGGDRLSLRVEAAEGALVHVTTPSATKVYRAETEPAAQRLTFTVGPRAYVEYVPEPLIPFAGAKLEQEVRAVVEPDGAFFYSEAITPGRAARGEAFAFDRLALWTTGLRDGSELFTDALVLEPGRRPATQRGLLGRHSYAGTAVAVMPEAGLDELVARLDEIAASHRDVAAAACVLPARSGAIVRALATSPSPLRRLLDEAWRAVREHLIGQPPPPRRK